MACRSGAAREAIVSSYYVADGTTQRGPFLFEELPGLGLQPQTLVWRAGMREWEPARSLPELERLFLAAAPPPEPPAATEVIDAPALTTDVPPVSESGASPPARDLGATGSPLDAPPPTQTESAPAPAPALPPVPLPPAELAYHSAHVGEPLPTGMAVTSLVLGIAAMPLLCVGYLGIPSAILALVFGFMARGKAQRGEAGGKGMALAGIILGGITLGLVVLAVALVLVIGVSIAIFDQ